MPKPSPAEIEALIPMVQTLVAQRFGAVPDHVAGRDDLVQIGMEAICKAAPRWSEDKGAAFRGFAYQRAWGGIQDWLRTASLGGRNHHAEVSVVSLDAPMGEDEGNPTTLGDLIPTEDFPADPFVLAAIEEALSGCPLDVQSAFALRHEEDATLAEIGSMMGVTESRASQMVTQAHDAIATHPAMEGLL